MYLRPVHDKTGKADQGSNRVPWGQVQEFGINPVDWSFPKASLEIQSNEIFHKGRIPWSDKFGNYTCYITLS